MIVASWNVNSIKVRLPLVLEWLEKHKADFLFLQEIKSKDENFPFEALKEVGYHAHVKGQPAYNGVAVLTPHADAEVKATVLPGDDSDDKARFMDVAWKDWRLINIYAPNGNPIGTDKFAYKLQWLDRLQKYMQDLLDRNQKFLVAGDYNIIPETVDARNPEEWLHDALFQPESRRKWRSFCNMGLIDAYRSLHPGDKDAFTFWDYQAGSWQRDNGIRIDHFLLSPKAADSLVSTTIDKYPRNQEKPSDHTPIIATFD